MGTVFTVASAKGGVGKTTTTASLGTTLAAAGYDVVAVDGDIGMANLATVLGLDPDGATLHAVLSGDADVEDAIYEGPDGLAVVPGSTDIDDFRKANATALGDVVERLREYDYVLLDTGAGLSHDNALPLGLADEVVLVSSPEPPALIDTDKTRQLADRLDAHVRGLVLTRVTENVTFEVPDQVNLDVPVLARIPYDTAVVEAFAARKPLCTHAPESPAAHAYRALAEELTGESLPVPAPSAPGTDPASDESDSTADERDDPDSTADERDESDSRDVAVTAVDDSTEPSDDDASRSVETGVANTLERVESGVEEEDDADPDADEDDASADASAEGSDASADSAEDDASADSAEDDASADSAEDDATESEPLVEEAEPAGTDADGEASGTSPSEESGGQSAGDDEGDATDAEDEDEKKGGFFRRLLGG